jgi:NAD(P)-dependent dehydrogenase (short-subunit alcohol dehydrogenase family)
MRRHLKSHEGPKSRHFAGNPTRTKTNYYQGGTPDIPAATIENMMAEHCPLKRCATPEDVARVVGFLSSEDGGWVNGMSDTVQMERTDY